MRLISKHKDYYDYIAKDRTMSDQSYIWARTPKEVNVDFALPRSFMFHSKDMIYSKGFWDRGTEAVSFVVWFCGRAIPFIKVMYEDKVEHVASLNELPDELQKDWDGIRKSGVKNFYNELIEVMDCGDKPWMANNFKVINLSGGVVPSKIEINEMHRKVGSPVFCTCGLNECMEKNDPTGCLNLQSYNQNKVIVNPILSAIGFHKIIDSFSAFNEIEKFLTNEMAPRDVRMDQPVPDTINAESHGFDKMSFRKEPSKNK